MTASVKDLNTYISQLTNKEKVELALALKKKLLQAEAERLSSHKSRKKRSMQDIVKEVRITRKRKNASKSRA